MKFIFIVTVTLFLSIVCNGQTADEIITKHINAIGGVAAWDSLKSYVIEGTSNMMGQQVNVKMYKKENKSCQELSVMGMTMLTGFDGAKAWMINPLSGNDDVVVLDSTESSTLAQGNPFENTFLHYKRKGAIAELIGEEKIGNENCYVLQLTKKTNIVEKHYISTTSFYLLKTESKQSGMATSTVNGKAQTITINYSNYKKEGNLVLPHTISIPIGDMTITKVTCNALLADTLFAIPSNK